MDERPVGGLEGLAPPEDAAAKRPVLVAGATGFIGSRLVEALQQRGVTVRCGARTPGRAPARCEGVALDVNDPASTAAALAGARAAYYLVHSLASGPGYAERDRHAAATFAQAAAAAGIERIVYLGGVAPQGHPSRHLASRLETGRILRAGPVPTVELRAGMIIGAGSQSWRMCRDLAARLPYMIVPRWLNSRVEPVAVDDVIEGLVAALDLPIPGSIVRDLPGPEVMTAGDVLLRIAHLRGMRPHMVRVPVLTPRLSSYWLRFVTGADYAIARELVEGLTGDLLSTEPPLWSELPAFRGPTPGEFRLQPFDVAARRALAEEGEPPTAARAVEALARRLAREW